MFGSQLGSLALGQLPPIVDIVCTMDVTEINGDIALFGIMMYNQAARCITSIKEIPATNSGALSVEET